MGKEIKVGDVVRLKSGGPPMTVHSVTDTQNVRVIWMEGGGMKVYALPMHTLMLCKNGKISSSDPDL
ncbi:MAG: DUF2158 domain-containing protein [Rhodobacteraceae bacterium]|nr:DUF2158 domain-containing protein [Paracoccaceae bacterium]